MPYFNGVEVPFFKDERSRSALVSEVFCKTNVGLDFLANFNKIALLNKIVHRIIFSLLGLRTHAAQ